MNIYYSEFHKDYIFQGVFKDSPEEFHRFKAGFCAHQLVYLWGWLPKYPDLEFITEVIDA